MPILALDQGTTSSRAILFGDRAEILATAQQELTQHFPKPGWVEHDPEEIWATQHVVMRAALEHAPASAIGITNQRETTVVWERASGKPIHNAIVWQDRRTADTCEKLRADGVEELVRRKTGLVLDAYFSATKAAWILDHVPGARQRAERAELAFGTIDSWIVWNLTAGAAHITDPSNASRTLLYNIHDNDWDDELLSLFRVPRAILPEIRSSSEVYAETAPGVADSRIPIAGIAGDQQAALFGQRCTTPGLAKCTFGTGCFLLLNTGATPTDSRNRLLTTVAWRRDNQTCYALEGSVFVAGALVQWLRDGLGIIDTAPEIEALAASVPDSDGVSLVPAFAGLGAPHWDPHARGLILGLTRGSTRAHIARAALDAIALQVADLLEAMHDDTGNALTELRVDGGAANNNLLMQTQADLLQTTIVRPAITETTALGAAFLAGRASDAWSSDDQLDTLWTAERRFHPAIPQAQAAERRTRWNEAVSRAKDWADPD